MYTDRGGLGRVAAWHLLCFDLPGGPVGPPTRWAAKSNVEVGRTTYPLNRIVGREGEKGVRKEKRGSGMGEGARDP